MNTYYNHLTDTWDTLDGTKIASEVIEDAHCLADIIGIMKMREQQRINTIKESKP
jgi:hypothetical protein